MENRTVKRSARFSIILPPLALGLQVGWMNPGRIKVRVGYSSIALKYIQPRYIRLSAWIPLLSPCTPQNTHTKSHTHDPRQQRRSLQKYLPIEKGHSRNFPHHLQNTSILRGIPGRRFSLLIFRQQRLSPGALSYCCRWMRCSFALCPTTHTQERREGVHERIKYTNRAGISYQNIFAVQTFQSCHR